MRFQSIVLLLCSLAGLGQGSGTTLSFKINSAILKEERLFDIYIPPPSKNKFEVVYVLDGQAEFSTVLDALKKLGHYNKIVVGLGNIWVRERDYTPTHVDSSPNMDSRSAAMSGGGAKFIEHLEKELIPYVNAHYATDTTKTLIGYSLGGLIAVDILLNHPGLFNKYLLIDPSMWWDDGKLLKRSEALLRKNNYHIDLFLAIGNTKNKEKDNIEEMRRDSSQTTALNRPTVLLLDRLMEYQKKNINLGWKYYKDQDHLSIFAAAISDGLRSILK